MAKLTKKQKRKQRKKDKTQHQKHLLAKKEKEQNKPKPWEPVKIKMFRMPNLFPEGISKEDRRETIRSIGSKARDDFENKYPSILEWFNNYDPLYLLSYCAYYFLSYPKGIDPEASGPLDFYPFYLEILQAFALTQQRYVSAKPLLEEGGRLKKEMREIGQLITHSSLDIPEELTKDYNTPQKLDH